MQDSYFKSYEDMEVHRLMLEDEPRTNTYREAICNHSDLFRDKVVMDLGAGTGILSLFCAKAGAKKVYAVEASSLGLILPDVFAANNYFPDTIEVVHGKIEEVSLEVQVDIIVSEWMGFYLLHESMLDSVIFARDKYLKPETGLMFPDRAQLFAAPCTLNELWQKRREYWQEPKFEFDLSPLLLLASQQSNPEIAIIPTDGLLSDPQLIADLNLNTITREELQTLSDRRFFSIESQGSFHGVGFWFTCSFPASDGLDPLELSTAPWDEETHWKQTVILLPSLGTVEEGEILGWELKLDKENNSRSYRIELKILDDDEPHPVPCSCGTAKCEIIKHFLSNPSSKDAVVQEDVGDASTCTEDQN